MLKGVYPFKCYRPSVTLEKQSQSHLMAQLAKNLPAIQEDPGLMPGWGRSPGEGNGYPFQYSCLRNLMDRGAWQAKVHGVAESWTQLID